MDLVLCDFDGTVSRTDVGFTILDHFSLGTWDDIDREFVEGRIGSREAYRRVAGRVRFSHEELKAFLEKGDQLDPYFPGFYQFLKGKGYKLNIISDGFEEYIQFILEKHHLKDIPFYANRIRFLPHKRVEFDFPYDNHDCLRCANCKRSIVERLRAKFSSIVYIGDGVSDRYAARFANDILARRSLYKILNSEGVPCWYFKDFSDVQKLFTDSYGGIIFSASLILENELEGKENHAFIKKEAIKCLRKLVGLNSMIILKKMKGKLYKRPILKLEGRRVSLGSTFNLSDANSKETAFVSSSLEELAVAEEFKTDILFIPRSRQDLKRSLSRHPRRILPDLDHLPSTLDLLPLTKKPRPTALTLPHSEKC